MDAYLESLRNAINRLDRAVEAYAEDPSAEFVRDALISRFAFTFSQVVATLKRYLDIVYFVPDAPTLSPRALVRHAALLGLITDGETWLQHVDNRNRVAHAYLESMAIMVANGAGAFAVDAKDLLTAIELELANDG